MWGTRLESTVRGGRLPQAAFLGHEATPYIGSMRPGTSGSLAEVVTTQPGMASV
jgi:hypothetical protein